MSDLEKGLTTEEEFKLALDGNSVDWFLQSLVNMVNGTEMRIGITLVTGGSIISGALVSGDTYFKQFAEEFSSGWRDFSDESKEVIRQSIAGHGEIYSRAEKADESETPPPQFIHLIDSRCFFPGNQLPNNRSVLWRGKINAISGFSLGQLSAGRSDD